MYAQSSREIGEAFWKTFGRYMSLVPGASGERINWINYKTGVKSVRFALTVADKEARVALTTNDQEVFAGLRQVQALFATVAGDDWTWEEGSITAHLRGKDLRRQDDWPELISFFKQRLIALDAFWNEVRDAFE